MRLGEIQKKEIGSFRSIDPRENWKALFLVALVLAAGVLSGCTGVVTATSGTATIQLNPASVNFGNVAVGKSSNETVTILNAGTASVTITQATVSNSQFKVSGVTLPLTVGAGQSATVTVSVTPTASGPVNGTLSVQGDSSAAPVVVNLTATGTAATPQISVSNTAISFGNVTINTQATSNLTISNTGNADLTVSTISVTGTGFAATGITTPKVISAGQTATLSVTFSPTASTASSGTISVASNDPIKPMITVTLSGTGTSAAVGNLQANQNNLSYGNVGTGTSSVKQIVLTNTGTAAVQITGISITGTGFTTSGVAVPTTLNPSTTATLSITFAPTAVGAISGNLTITSNASGSPLAIPISGTGVQAGLSVSPASFNFGSVIDGQSKSQSFTITNSGSASLTISQLSISAAGYTVNGLTVPSTIAAGGSTTFNAVFVPATAGSLAGTVNIVSNAPNSPTAVALSGTGVAQTQTITLSSSSLAFGSVNTGTSSTLNETITNTGNSSVTISQISVSGTGYSLNGAGAPVTLNAGQALTFGVIFDPASAGALNGTVTVTSNASGSPSTITLSGTGVQVATHTVGLTWNASTSTVSGYNVYRSLTSGTGYIKINGTLVPTLNYTDSSVQNATTYFYVTTAVDSAGTESAFSNEASAVIP